MSSFGQESTAKWQGSQVMLAYIAPMYDPVIAPGADGLPTRNGIISDWRFSPSGDTTTLTVRPGVKFHNGAEVTADDIKFTLDTFARPGLANNAGGVLRTILKDIAVKDKSTVEISLKSPDVTILQILSWFEGDTAVIPKSYFESLPGNTFEEKSAEFVKQPVGTGPFIFVTRELGRSIEFKANKDYFDKQRIPKFDRLVLLSVPESSTRVNMLRTNEADIIEADGEQAAQLQGSGFKTYLARNVLHGGLIFARSWDSSFITSDVRVRKALTLAVDRPALVKALFPEIPGLGSTGAVAAGPLGHGPGVAGYRPDFPSYPYDPQEARRLLEQAGYFQNPKTIVGWSFGSAAFSAQPKVLQGIAEYWKAIGVKVEIRASDQAAVIAKYLANPPAFESNDVAMVNFSWRPSGVNNLRTPATINAFIQDRPKVEALRNKVLSIGDSRKYDEEMAAVWRVMYDDYWALPVVWINKVLVVNPKVVASYTPPPSISDYAAWETIVVVGGK